MNRHEAKETKRDARAYQYTEDIFLNLLDHHMDIAEHPDLKNYPAIHNMLLMGSSANISVVHREMKNLIDKNNFIIGSKFGEYLAGRVYKPENADLTLTVLSSHISVMEQGKEYTVLDPIIHSTLTK